MYNKNRLKEFISYLKYSKNYSENTVESYNKDISEFFSFCEENGIDEFYDINAVRYFISYLSIKGDRGTSINRKISAIRGFFRYLYRNGYVDKDISRLIKSVKEEKKVPSFLSKEEMRKLLDGIPYEGDMGIRDRAIIELMYSTGIRASELINITFDDIDMKERILKVKGKGNKERIVPFGEHAHNAIEEYLKIRGKYAKIGEKSLFIGKRGKRLNRRTLYNIIHKYLSLVSSVPTMSPHTLRHTFATHLLEGGADIRFVQELLGHSKPSTTQKYTHIDIEYLKNVYKSSHPHGKKE